MIVYGDPQWRHDLGALWAELSQRATEADTAGSSLSRQDDLRALVAQAGQLEQAVEDEPAAEPYRAVARNVTAHVAAALCASHLPGRSSPAAHLAAARRVLSIATPPAGLTVRTKLPEGFAFYALYPELYVASALRWADERTAVGEQRGRAYVVGIRSIGTALSAVVAATLSGMGWRVTRLTVRPAGDPYDRRVSLLRIRPSADSWGLVVDEGPGRSGSSMAAACTALAAAGIMPERIALFPGHAGQSGQWGSTEARDWWSGTARYDPDSGALRLNGETLAGTLSRLLTDTLPGSPRIASLEDVSQGKWRRLAYPAEANPPATIAMFERPKLLATTEDGRRFLLKFEGFAGLPGGVTTAEAAIAQACRLSEEGWTVPPAGSVCGYVCTPWIEGTRLSASSPPAGMAALLGQYIHAAAGQPLPPRDVDAAFHRLTEMLYWNTWEALGARAAERTRLIVEAAKPDSSVPLPTYGDGHLAPHEWVSQGDTPRPIKTDCAGHTWDHTTVGVQPVWWDLASAIVEWHMGESAVAEMLESFGRYGGLPPQPAVLTFYTAAYSAFRAGLAHMDAGGDMGSPLYRYYSGALDRIVGA